MKSNWAYRVVVSTDEDPIAYEGHFETFSRAEKAASRKLDEHKGTGAIISIYARYDGTCTTWVA